MTTDAQERLRKGLLSGYPIFYLQGEEEGRMAGLLADLARSQYGPEGRLVLWSAVRGFHTQDGRVDPGQMQELMRGSLTPGPSPGGRGELHPSPAGGRAGDEGATSPCTLPTADSSITDPVVALERIAAGPDQTVYLMLDLPALFAGNPRLARALRDLYGRLAGRAACVCLAHPDFVLPDELKKQVFLVSLGLPTEAEILAHIGAVAEAEGVAGRLDRDWRYQCAAGLRGMSLDEIGHLMLRLIRADKLDLATAIPEIIEEKSYALMKEGCLRYVAKSVRLDQVGGLDNLKEWVLARKPLFTRQAFESGVPLPSGILFTGVSGCGKSMAAKVVAGAWNLPLVRLDMNLVLSGAYGSPEYAFDHALRVAEAIAPLVLWIDEMENSFGYDLQGNGGNNNIFASFLTWMQEKPATVFVVATANRIEKLPAEVIRKGRFDQLFFLDLPTEEERRAILRIHIAAFGADPATFNLNLLTAVTKNWSGAEIEQAIKAARIRGYQEGRMFTEQDVVWNTARMVPLSRTMEEQMKQLRLWSVNRATPASKKPEAAV